MKRMLLWFLLSTAASIGLVDAELIDRGGGLIFDTTLNVTWLQDANYAKTTGYAVNGMNWQQATDWAGNLTYFDPIRNVTWTDWRLPQVLPVNGTSYIYSLSYNGSTDIGPNISAPGSTYLGSTASEMASLFYSTLGNSGMNDVNGNAIDWNDRFPQNTGPLTNVSLENYWTNTEVVNNPGAVLHFGFSHGYQGMSGQQVDYNVAWAVRSGDVGAPTPVPEPATMLMLGAGLIGLAGYGRKRLN